MKNLPITIHPFSALIGAALVCLTMLTVGAIAVQGSSSTRDVSAIEIVSDPHPRDFVRITGSTPFTVPAGRILTVTGIGTSYMTNQQVEVYINGNRTLSVYLLTDFGLFREFSKGLTALAGDVVSITSNAPGGTQGVALGYLVDA